jgi:hypothetical protein
MRHVSECGSREQVLPTQAVAAESSVRKPPVPRRAVSDKIKAASNAFEAAKAAVSVVGLVAFLVLLLIGYVATGGDSIGGFLDFLGW